MIYQLLIRIKSVTIVSCKRFSCMFLVLLSVLALGLEGVHANLLIILLQGGHVLPGLRELSLLHALSDVPVNKGTLGVHEVELVVKPGPRLGDCGGVGEHADSSLDLGQVASGHHSRRLVVNANLEASGAPVHKLDASLGLDGGDGSVDILGDHIAPVEHAAGHILAMAGVALHHLVGGLKAGVGYLRHTELLVVSLLGGDDGGVGDQGEVDPGVGDQVGLELSEIHVEGSVEPQGSRDRGDDLADQPVQVGVARTLNVEIPAADVVDRLVVDHEGAVAVLEGGMRAQGGVVGLDHGGGDLGSWVDAELQLGLLAVVDGETLHQERCEARPSSTTERVEDEESLEASAVVGQLPDPVEHKVDDLLANSVMATSVVVGSVLLARHHLLWVEELPVGASPDLVNDGGLQVEEDSPWNVLPGASLAEEGGEGIILGLVSFHSRDLAIGLDSVLHAVELPAGITHLDSSLANVDGDAFPHLGKVR